MPWRSKGKGRELAAVFQVNLLLIGSFWEGGARG